MRGDWSDQATRMMRGECCEVNDGSDERRLKREFHENDENTEPADVDPEFHPREPKH